jgi:hypothetical protein
MPGHAWKRVVHDPTVTWLAYWKENIMNGHKYVFLAASSSFKGKSDLQKYEKARRLKKVIDKIRAHYERLLQSSDPYERQSGTAMWIIDRLALRVGGEKDEDEADTVGCCSLRAEHLSFPAEGGAVTFDFLGKDSMRYFQTIDVRTGGGGGGGRRGRVGRAERLSWRRVLTVGASSRSFVRLCHRSLPSTSTLARSCCPICASSSRTRSRTRTSSRSSP